jgi:hypothetical protein
MKAFFVRLPPSWKLAKALGFRVDRTFERTNANFVIVTGIDDRNIRALDQRIPFSG